MYQKSRSKVFAVGTTTLVASGLIMGFTGAKSVPVAALTQLIFVSNRSGIVNGTPNGNEIWTMNADGTNPQRLTWDIVPSAEWEPHWNPAGTKIAFTSNRTGDWDVYTMDPDGTHQVNLTNDAAAYDFGAAWSPDGQQIAFATDRDNPGSGVYDIYVMNMSNPGFPVNLTSNLSMSAGHPVWSSTGKIAFTGNLLGNDDIYTLDPNNPLADPVRLTNNAATDFLPEWSPDGSKIAFTSNRDGNYEVYSMNANGTGVTRLTNNSAEDGEPAWSPDGTKIAFYSLRNGNYELYSMNANGKGNPTRLTNNNPYLDGDVAWKPQ